MWLLLAFDGDALVGYMALEQKSQRVLGMRAVRLGWLTAYHSDRPHLVTHTGYDDAVSTAMYSYLLSRKPEWALLEFEQQDATSALRQLPDTAHSEGCRFRTWPNMANAMITLRWPNTAAYFAALSPKSRSNISRQMRTLLAAGEVELLSSSDPRCASVLFDLYCVIEAHSWKAHTDESFGGGQRWTAYYASLIDEAQPMRMVIQVLLLDGVPIAGMISGAFDNGLYALHTVYDERLASLAPGSAIFLMSLRLAIEGGYRFLNLLWGFGYYKERWLAQMTPTESLQIVRLGTPYYWRQQLGKMAHASAQLLSRHTPERFNRARRRAEAAEPAHPYIPGSALATPAELARYRMLALSARSYGAEHLSAVELAAVMPFSTQRLQRAPTG